MKFAIVISAIFLSITAQAGTAPKTCAHEAETILSGALAAESVTLTENSKPRIQRIDTSRSGGETFEIYSVMFVINKNIFTAIGAIQKSDCAIASFEILTRSQR